MKITIIGAGNMGGAFARGLLSFKLGHSELAEPDSSLPARSLRSQAHFNRRELELILSDHEDKHAAFKDLEVKMTSDNSSAVAGADVVILAVKPFDMETVCHEISSSLSIEKLGRSKPAEPDFSLPARSLRSQLSPKTVIISIAAGVKIEKIAAALENSGHSSAGGRAFPIVRAMPNLPATIGESMSGWVCSPSVTPEQKKIVRKILQSIGAEIEVESEDDIDRVTAVSGSGPAYVWKFMESMISAGMKIGLSQEQSRVLTSQTFFGAAKMAHSKEPLKIDGMQGDKEVHERTAGEVYGFAIAEDKFTNQIVRSEAKNLALPVLSRAGLSNREPYEDVRRGGTDEVDAAKRDFQRFPNPEDVSVLRQRVTSKGGTTERALEVFKENHFDLIMENAVKTAYERAKELGK